MELQEFKLENYSDFKRSMFIQASAGTGKTYTITGILQKLLDKKIAELKEILVVTYTEKAAGELRDRIREACPDEDIDNAPIFTIHSFCQKTLSEFYFTANQCANLSLVDKTAIDDFIDHWIRDVLIKDPEFKKLFETSAKESTFINNLTRDFKEAVSKYYLDLNGKEDKNIVSLDSENLSLVRDHILTFENYKKFLHPSSIEDFYEIKDFESQWKYLQENLQAKKAAEFQNDILNHIEKQQVFTFNGSSFQKRWVGNEIKETFDFLKKIKDDLDELLKKEDSIPRMLFYNSQLKNLYLAWQQEKEKNKSQTYDDMLRSVREAVCSRNSPLKKQLQKKYKYAIIDEFQDTNQKQWDIFQSIFMEDDQHTIIVVGDPKQAIYSFQGADVNVYTSAVKSIADKGGAACSLQTNYRSTNAMVQACNLLFKDFFDPDSHITFTDSKVSGTKNPAQYCGKEIKPFWIAGTPDNPVNENDFAKISIQKIVDCCSFENGKTKLQVTTKDGLRNVSFRDFAILCRSSSELKETEHALKKAGIPFLRYKDGNLFSGKECLHWMALINAITAKDFTSTNRRILNEALFSDFFNISINEVNDEKYDNPSCPERQLIIQWQQLARQRKWAKLFEKIYADTDIENRLSSLDKMQSLSKIRQIGNYSLDYLYKNDCSLEDVSRQLLRLSTNSQSTEDEGDIVEKGTDFDCVQLMTIHASKGLEFPVVIVPAGLRAKNNQRAQVYLYHEKNKARLSFTPYGSELSDIEDDWERERIYYVAYTRASSLLILPFYDVWDSKINSTKSKLYTFLYKSISSLFADEGKKYVEEISDSGKILEDLQKDVQKLLAENKKQKEKEKGSQPREEISEEAQIKATRELSEKVSDLSLHKHSYSSLSHRKNISDDMTQDGGRTDKEDANLQQVSLANFDACENPVTYTVIPDSEESCPPADEAPYNYPKGARLGIALHEVFEKADFEKTGQITDCKAAAGDEGLGLLIRACFEKQTLTIAEDDPDHWLAYTTSVLWKTLKAKLPEIAGGSQTGNYFSLAELKADDRISEAEFNMNLENSEKLKNYCNGFIDLVFKRTINGKEVYSILDWKSDTFEADLYAKGGELKAHTDDRYSIQRVLYSYSLIKWLSSFYKNETEDQVFENHFGGIYYAYVRGCQNGACSGIYARTWKNWKELENSFKQILKDLKITA